MSKLTITCPDDWHLHLRDGAALARTVPDAAKQFARAIIMPNLTPPVTSLSHALDYRERIIKHIPKNHNFNPLMTLYLNNQINPIDLKAALSSQKITALKLYPKGVTTNAESGIDNLKTCYPLLDIMQQYKIPLLIHAETNNPNIDIFDREKVFIETTITQLRKDFPELKIVIEHISTAHSAEFVNTFGGPYLAATITTHHLYYTRNDLLSGGIKPHYYCLPILKRHEDREALIKAAISGKPYFFLGSDSAPHAQTQKESSCGCAGIYSGYNTLGFYLEIFERFNALEKFEAFASFNGPDFYGLPRNKNKIKLIKKPMKIPQNLKFQETMIIPMATGEIINWQIEGEHHA